MSFAKLTPERRSELARKANAAAQRSPNRRRWTPEEQREHAPKGSIANLNAEEREEMGRLGGEAAQASGNARRWTREEAREANRKAPKWTSEQAREAALLRWGKRKVKR